MNEQAIRAVVAHWRHIAVAAWGGAGIQHAGKAIGDFADDIIAALNDNTTCVTNCSVCKNRAVTDAMIESERYLMRLQLAAAAADDILQAWRDDPHYGPAFVARAYDTRLRCYRCNKFGVHALCMMTAICAHCGFVMESSMIYREQGL